MDSACGDQGKEADGASKAHESYRKALGDTPLSAEELKKMGKNSYWVTEAACAWLKNDGEGHCFWWAQKEHTLFSEKVRDIVIRRFQNLNRQLTLAEAKDVVEFVRKKQLQELEEARTRAKNVAEQAEARKKFMDLREESDLPTAVLDDQGRVTCDPQLGCGDPFKAISLNVVIDGEAVRVGNFWLVNNGGGNIDRTAFCRDCGEQYRRNLPHNADKALSRSYTYEEAGRASEEKTAGAKREIERQKRLGQVAQAAGNVPDKHSRPLFRAPSVSQGMEDEARALERSRRDKRGVQGSRRHR